MQELAEVDALRRQQLELRRQADELEKDLEAVYQKINICPDCEGRGHQTVMVPKRVFLGWPDCLYHKICARCHGNGQYVQELPVKQNFTAVPSYHKNQNLANGRFYWG